MDHETQSSSEAQLTGPGGIPPTSRQDLNQLIERVAKRDRAAFARLYEATAPKLMGVVVRILGDRAWSEDVIQEAYVKVWQKAEQFNVTKSSPITWMVSIARNAAIDEVRKHPSWRNSGDGEIDVLPSPHIGVEIELENQQTVTALNHCIDQLEKERQDMIRLAYLNGWSRDQLAAHFDQPVNTVKTWLHRALKQLKRCLAP